MIFNGQSLQYTLGLPLLPTQSELAFSLRQHKAPQPSDAEAHLDWGNLLADSKNIPDCLKMCDALQGTDRDSLEFEEYRLLAQMVVSNQKFWPKPPKDSVKEQLDLAEKEVLLAAENLALKQASSRNAVQDVGDRANYDKIFSVC